MWKKVLFNISIIRNFPVRTYVPREGNIYKSKPVKLIKGKVMVSPKESPAVSGSLQRKEFVNSYEYEEDPESFGDFESDFLNVHHSEKEHESEENRYKKQVRYWTVKGKYFKQNIPNFLTYAEKEQIKILNSRDPEEWTSEKISESFPALPITIKKIINAKWTARTTNRIRQHDQSVMRNWDLFNKGKIENLTKDLAEHLQKFAKRSDEDLKDTEIMKTLPKFLKPKLTEFSSIITSCNNYMERRHVTEENETKNEYSINKRGSAFPSTDESFVTGKITDRRNLRFEDLKKDTLIPIGKDTSRTALTENPGSTGILKFGARNPTKITEITMSKEDMKTYEVSPIKERIHIPRKLWKRGASYKVEDCYYDDDGLFLYRVPGMTGKKA